MRAFRSFGVCILISTGLLVSACGNSPNLARAPLVPLDDPGVRTRYAMNNQCFVLQSTDTGAFVAAIGGNYFANEGDITLAEGFYFKPTALGSYMLYNRDRQVLSANGAIGTVDLQAADDTTVFSVLGVGDTTNYPPTPESFREPTKSEIDTYRAFADPNTQYPTFTFTADNGQNLATNENGALVLATAATDDAQSFMVKPVSGCEEFPEASSNTSGETFKGTTPDGRVLGMVDAHVHISATDFLGRAEWGTPFHPHGVTHALGLNCEEYHGPNGTASVVEAGFEQDTDGHDTTGWPTFPEWPNRNNLFHEAIYWKWLERSWMAGLRIIVNDLVDNETLCELSRNVAGDPTIDCNSMNNAGRQAGTMYAMQDYIDAQYGGRGEGFFQITHHPDEARARIEEGKAAVILGIEISNFLDCKVNYAPTATRTQEAFEEDGTTPGENIYSCNEASMAINLQRIHDWGVRQVITIHEFDNAFGGNGIFGGLVLNLGNREDTGAIPGGALANPTAPSNASGPPELPNGEFWTTYDCPVEGEIDHTGELFSGYLWSDSGGDDLESLDPTCNYQGQGRSDEPGSVRPGGPTFCYPAEDNFSPSTTTRRQCNARWLTPLGLNLYKQLMEVGMIFDIDHLEMEMKTQALELAEAQDPPYPFVSTHGTFGGTSLDQARRILDNGGVLYPSIGGINGFLNNMAETRGVHTDGNVSHLFGFGFGTDTNGLSGQAGPRGSAQVEANPITYPYDLFVGGTFDQLSDFDSAAAVTFHQPEVRDPDGVGRTWHVDVDGHAQYGMMSGTVREMMLEGSAQDMQDMFNAAEVYLRMWTATLASQAGILAKTANDTSGNGQGNAVEPRDLDPNAPEILRSAPLPDCEIGRRTPDTTSPECVTPP